MQTFEAHPTAVDRGWGNGFKTCAHWLNWRVGLDLGAAREKVRVAHALATLPLIREALAAGEISYSKARAVTRVATPETEERLLQVARAGTAAHVEQIVRGWRTVDRHAEVHDAARQHRLRGLQIYRDEDGTVVIRGRLTPEAGSVVEVGARTRTIPAALRRALLHRDRGCRFPGCGLRFVEGHHIQHWAQGGPTTLSNLASLCRFHHRAVHEEGYQMERRPDGSLEFWTPQGRPLRGVPPARWCPMIQSKRSA